MLRDIKTLNNCKLIWTTERTLGNNISWIRRFTISLIKQNLRKGNVVGKRKKAAWSFDFLIELVLGNPEHTTKHAK